MKLSIARIVYPVTTLGPGNRVGIWTTGCPRSCSGCISPELQVYDERREMSPAEVVRVLRTVSEPIDGFTISGGEPFLNPAALRELVQEIVKLCDDVIIFTGYSFRELQEEKDADISAVLSLCSVLIDGPYVEELHSSSGLRGSDNQTIWVFRHPEKYKEIETCERSLQMIVRDGNVITIGIP